MPRYERQECYCEKCKRTWTETVNMTDRDRLTRAYGAATGFLANVLFLECAACTMTTGPYNLIRGPDTTSGEWITPANHRPKKTTHDGQPAPDTNPYGPPGLTHLSVLSRPVGSGIPDGIGIFRRASADDKPELVAHVSIEEFDRIAKVLADIRDGA